MTEIEQRNLVAEYAPLMWLHEREAFVPEDCGIIVQISDLYRKGNREDEQPAELDDLGQIRDSKECYLKIRDLDMREFQLPDAQAKTIGEMGPDAVARLASSRYGYDLAAGIPADNHHVPKYYARVSKASLDPRDGDPFTEYYRTHDPGVFGTYKRIEYFYYFVFNDAWNKHQSDWDSMVEVFIKDDRTYMVSRFHHCRWAARWPQSPQKLTSWLDEWNALSGRSIGECLIIGQHPNVFVALGAHGGYPTPGFSIHGKNLPGLVLPDDFLATTDVRQIGRICIHPGEVTEDTVRAFLRFGNVDANRITFAKWREPELVRDQPWLGYEGKGGEDTAYIGWDGPARPPITQDPSKESLQQAIAAGTGGGGILKSWHGAV